jgi:hypothetical protein
MHEVQIKINKGYQITRSNYNELPLRIFLATKHAMPAAIHNLDIAVLSTP